MNRILLKFIGLVIASISTVFLIIYVFKVKSPSSSSASSSPSLLELQDAARRNYKALIQPGVQGPYKKPKILCWVLTAPKYLDTRAKAVKTTWGKRCDKTLFFSSTANASFPTIGLNVSEGRDALPNKTIGAFTYCYEKYGQDFDWFMKADDDTYVIVENLRKFVSNYSSLDPIYFGHNFYKYFKQGYMSGGAGYVLSKEALRVFVTKGVAKTKPMCKIQDIKNEDILVGACLDKLDVKAIDTVDEYQRERFLPLDLIEYAVTGFPFWLPEYSKFKPKLGVNCCAEDLISMHYVKPVTMYVYDMLLHRVKVDRNV
ncbi:glycoprotein-N-acetylgalactosamine 3-beta-galactosyltransferase 1 [Patella vulgata]|uniref:glycoprotein-N-acetylgalactosamine 3-beta-galactosyltransferase 1 n=1 Tax=Patella vulgata TaxID=6465 RepID=UPI0024A90D7A|nr:glycoprotein-N-acetylgalactosamine 3-beta-galactosyltransferase 1 [Patella vulgata]